MSYHEGSNWQAKKEDHGKSLYENPSQEIETLKDELANRETIIAGHEETIRQLGLKHYGYWQVCPKCEGEGEVQLKETSKPIFGTCPVCNGAKLLVRPEIKNDNI